MHKLRNSTGIPMLEEQEHNLRMALAWAEALTTPNLCWGRKGLSILDKPKARPNWNSAWMWTMELIRYTPWLQ